MRSFIRSLSLFSLGLLLAACSGANQASIYRNYSLESSGDTAESVLIDAKQRAILSAPTSQVRFPPGQESRQRKVIVCAEPSPDALSAISSTFSASASGIFGSGDQVQAALSSALSETASQLGQRNATIQLLRDGLYRQCEAYMNGLIDREYYEQIANKYTNAMVTLLAVEELTAQGAKSQTASAKTALSSKTDTEVSTPVATESEGAAPAESSQEAEGQQASGSAGSSATAAPPVINVNLPEGSATVEPHVSTAVNTMVTWFLTKDTVDYCLRGLFSGTKNENPAFQAAFINVCTQVIQDQMAQQGQMAAAYETAAANTGTYGFDDCSASIRSFWKPDGTSINAANVERLQGEMRTQGVSGPVTMLIRTQEREGERRKVGAALGLAGCS